MEIGSEIQGESILAKIPAGRFAKIQVDSHEIKCAAQDVLELWKTHE